MKKHYFTLFIIFSFLFAANFLFAQANQCPGCVADVSCTLSPAYPTLCPKNLPVGTVGQSYDETISFYMPATFVDPGSGITVTLLEVEILNLVNMPYGLNWTSNIYPSKIYFPSSNPPSTEHGCVKVCGTPVLTYDDSINVYIRVKVDAGIGGIVTQYQSFKVGIKILPGSSGNTGFTVTNGSGCSPITTSFQANYKSGGDPLYSYSWDFGNNLSSQVENPPSQIYTTPGTYLVTLKTTIDTLPYMLKSIDILSSDCTDFWSSPDFYVVLKDGSKEILNTQKPPYAAVLDKDPPVKITFNPVRLNNTTYKLQVNDEDGGLGGVDDACSEISFNGHTAGVFTVSNGALIVKYEITHSKLVFNDTAKITVYPNPATPLISSTPNDSVCVKDTILLSVGAETTYQWYKDTVQIINANAQDYKAFQNGSYSVKVSNQFGCIGKSAAVKLNFIPNPPKPTLWTVSGTINTNLSGYQLQWYGEGTKIQGANKMTYTPTLTGNYYLVATNYFGCSTHSDSVYITCPIVQAIVIAPNDSACINDTIVLSSSGGSVYQWYKDTVMIPNAIASKYNAMQTGSYHVKVTNGFGCSVKSQPVSLYFMANPPKPSIQNTGNNLSTNATGVKFQWLFGGHSISGATGSQYTALSSGYYKLEIENNNGCKSQSDSIYINYIGIPENGTFVNDFNIFPNPGNGLFNITFSTPKAEKIKMQIIDILGKTIWEETGQTQNTVPFERKIDISEYNSGIYLFLIRNSENQVSKRILIEK